MPTFMPGLSRSGLMSVLDAPASLSPALYAYAPPLGSARVSISKPRMPAQQGAIFGPLAPESSCALGRVSDRSQIWSSCHGVQPPERLPADSACAEWSCTVPHSCRWHNVRAQRDGLGVRHRGRRTILELLRDGGVREAVGEGVVVLFSHEVGLERRRVEQVDDCLRRRLVIALEGADNLRTHMHAPA